MIVIDASAAIEWVLQTTKGAEVEARIFRKRGGSARLHAPHLLDVEVAQVLRKHVMKGGLSDGRGQTALQDFLQIPLLRYPHDFLLERVWALRKNLTACDASMKRCEGKTLTPVRHGRYFARIRVCYCW